MKGASHLTISLIVALLCGAALGVASCANQGAVRDASSDVRPPTLQARTDEQCARLTELALEHVEIQSALAQSAQTELDYARRPGMTGENTGAPVSNLPAFCRVTGTIRPETNSNIRFEVWLPMENWNGRLFGANNGGLAGSIRYDDLAAAIANGAIGAATDTGHSSTDQNWARGRPDLVRDYGWRGIHETTVAAKDIARAFYGRRPDNSYFVGCSNGGRMALIEAARFPEDYDGIVAGAPAASFTALVSTMVNNYRVQQPPGAAIRPDQAQLIQSEVLRQCDDLDGQHDGLIADPLQCRFDYAALACGTSSSPQCFTAPQIAALRQIHAGPHNSAGERVGYGFPASGSEVSLGNAGWDMMLLSPRGPGLASAFLQDMPARPIATAGTFNFDTDPARLGAELGADLDARPDLRRFFDRGGKLIIWHGWADPVLPPEAALAYYQAALQQSGPRAASSMRLFMMPGVQHCSGGAGADSFGQIGAAPIGASPEHSVAAAVVDWVEEGRVPESVIGRHGELTPPGAPRPSGPLMERLHCAYPARSVLRESADPNQAASYSCRAVSRQVS